MSAWQIHRVNRSSGNQMIEHGCTVYAKRWKQFGCIRASNV